MDGDVSEWEDKDKIMEEDGISVWSKYDEKYVYFRIHKDGYHPETDVLYVPIDTTPKTGSHKWAQKMGDFERAAEFLMIIDGKENSRVLVQERYEAVSYTHLDVYKRQALNRDGVGWKKILDKGIQFAPDAAFIITAGDQVDSSGAVAARYCLVYTSRCV